KIEAEGANVHAGLPQPDGDAGRIETAGKIQAYFAFAVEPAGNGFLAAAADEADRRLAIVELRVQALLQREVRRKRELAALPGGDVAGQQAAYAAYRHVLAGHKRKGQILVQRGRIHRDGQSW